MDFFYHVIDLLLSDRFFLYRNVAAVIGILYVSYLLFTETWTIISGFYTYFVVPRFGFLRTNLKQYGKWAVVTGASEGIGKGYAVELARQGLNVVIMSRSEEKLQLVANEIRENGCEVRIVPVDFSCGQEVYPRIAKELSDLDIGILVNNVGYSYEYPELVGSVDEERLRNMVELNCQTVVQMTRLVLPRMVEKKCGAIINISSASSYNPEPNLNVYAASKIFVNHFSDALRKEYSSRGIYIQTMTPYFIATAMTGVRRASFFIPSPTSFTHAAVATIGMQDTAIGCFSHALMYFVSSRMPAFLRSGIAQRTLIAAKQRHLRRKSKQLQTGIKKKL